MPRAAVALALLAGALILLKTTGSVTWSWAIVLAPFWLPIVSFIGFALLCLCLYALAIGGTGRGGR